MMPVVHSHHCLCLHCHTVGTLLGNVQSDTSLEATIPMPVSMSSSTFPTVSNGANGVAPNGAAMPHFAGGVAAKMLKLDAS